MKELELQASGGRGYLKESDSSFIRRWNEGVFLPIVSPSAVQLRHILANQLINQKGLYNEGVFQQNSLGSIESTS